MDKHLIVYMNTLMRADKHSVWLHPEPQVFWKGGCSDERSLKQSSLDVLASIDKKHLLIVIAVSLRQNRFQINYLVHYDV